MRLFDLFLRRAGVDRASAVSGRHGTSRLTVVCQSDDVGSLRKQVCSDFGAVGLSVTQFQIDANRDAGYASACITVNCPPDLRSELMSQAKRLQANPVVRHVQFGVSSSAMTSTVA